MTGWEIEDYMAANASQTIAEPDERDEVHIHAPDGFPRRRQAHCPTCGDQTNFAGLDQPWYGTTWTCCTCGDRWTDGEMHARPFKPRWRQENIAAAQQVWEAAEGRTDEDHKAWLREQLGGSDAVSAADGDAQ